MTDGAPGGSRPALSRAVAVEPGKFAAAYWGKAPLLSRAGELAGPDGFADLLSPDAVDELLGRRGLRTPFLRVAQQGQVLPASRFTGGGGVGAEVSDQVIDDQVMKLYAEGATLVLQGLHRLWPPLIDYTRRLGAELRRPLQVNAYLTPPGSQGFSTHYDTHDVFVLQVDGTKRWRLHEPVLADPLEKQAWGGRADEVGATAQGEPAMDIVLSPGDALYLPRGWLHSAAAQDGRSLHVTLGVRALTRYALVEELLALAATRTARLRATLPFAAGRHRSRRRSTPELTETVEALRDLAAAPSSRPRSPQRLQRAGTGRLGPAGEPIRPLAQLDFADRPRHRRPRSRVREGSALAAGRGRLRPRRAARLDGRTMRFPASCARAVNGWP